MNQSLLLVALVVRDYDEAIAFYTQTLRFELVEDTYIPEQDKRWVVIAPPGSSPPGSSPLGSNGTRILLARPSNDGQAEYIGNQTGGRVTFFLGTDDFWRDYHEMRERGVRFLREPKTESYGTVAVFEDLYGNLWDLLEPTPEFFARSRGVAE